jgi:hypothetical protein
MELQFKTVLFIPAKFLSLWLKAIFLFLEPRLSAKGLGVQLFHMWLDVQFQMDMYTFLWVDSSNAPI